MMTTTYEDEDNSSGGSQPQGSQGSKRKRRATEECKGGELDDKALKRQKNREAAKKCRDRKNQVAEDLRQKIEELQQENCQVVRQRDDMMRRCIALEEQLKHHKEQGCDIADLEPLSMDLNHILDPSTPPSPSFAGSQTASPSSASCYSPVPLDIPLDDSPLPSFKADPVSGKFVFGDEANVFGVQDNGKTQQRNSQDQRNLTTSTQRTVMRVRPATATATATPQQVTGPAQDTPCEWYPFHVRDKDGSVKKLDLSRGDYIKVMAKMKALESTSANRPQKHSDLAPAVYSSSPQLPPQAFSTQQMKQEIPSELVSRPGQSVSPQFHVKATVQSPELTDPFSIGTDFVSLLDDYDALKDYLPVDPNEVLMENKPIDAGYDKMTNTLFEDESAAAELKVVDNQYTDSNIQAFSNQHQLSAQPAGSNLDSFMIPGDESLCYVHAENTDRLPKQESPSNNEMLTITVTDPKTAQIVEQTSSPYSRSAGKLTQPLGGYGGMLLPIVSSQKEQTVFHTIPANDLTRLSLSKTLGKTCQDVPVMLQEAEPHLSTKPVLSSLRGLEVSEHQPSTLDLLSDMKTVKLRPKMIASTSSPRIGAKTRQTPNLRVTATPSQTYWDRRATTSSTETQFVPLKDGSIGSSETAGLLLASLGDFLQTATQQQVVSQRPVILMPQNSNAQSFPVRGRTFLPVDDPHITDSDCKVLERLAETLEAGQMITLE